MRVTPQLTDVPNPPVNIEMTSGEAQVLLARLEAHALGRSYVLDWLADQLRLAGVVADAEASF